MEEKQAFVDNLFVKISFVEKNDIYEVKVVELAMQVFFGMRIYAFCFMR